MILKKENRQRRHKRIRAKVSGTVERPRLCVFRSSSHIYAQLINDKKSEIILSVNDFGGKEKKSDRAIIVGKKIAELAIKKGIKKVVFDRGGYKYHGRVKLVADGAREGGLDF
jgi:large subunit ribosomal protein L18